jgi:hypothetical protein
MKEASVELAIQLLDKSQIRSEYVHHYMNSTKRLVVSDQKIS